MKVVHVITGLEIGGAELMLFRLLAAFGRDGGPESAVISLAPPGPVAAKIEGLGISVASPRMGRGAGALLRIGRLVRLIRAARADLIMTWMYHANLLGSAAACTAGAPPLIWNLRQSALDPRLSKPGTRLVARLGARLSWSVPACIVCVSERARADHVAMGYDGSRMTVIPNGFDLARFRPDAAARDAVRRELGLGSAAPLVGLVARFDPQKDHATFIAAARRIVSSRPEVHFLCAGAGTEDPALAALIEGAGVGRHVHALGPRDDVSRLTAALDVAVSSSAFGEGFSNALGEALASGVPAVATDVGDSAAIVGEDGRVVPPGDAEALAGAVVAMLALDPAARAAIVARARARMAERFDIAAIAARYRALFEDTARRAAAAGPG